MACRVYGSWVMDQSLFDIQTHPGLFAALEHEASSETKARMRNTSPMHIEAIKLWLDSTKIVTFS